MAKSRTTPPKKPTPISLGTSTTALEEPPPEVIASEPAEPEPQAPPATAAAPPSDPKPAPPKTPTFFQTMNKVPKADWGPRANIYLYRVEPMIDRTRSGESKFINNYAEPVNEDRIMADHGSGRYKLILNFRKPGAETGDIIDSIYMDILNMKYPPKIPLGEWTDDPRNRKWAWAKEASAGPVAPAQPAATGVETFVDVLRATGDIRREIREEMQSDKPEQPSSTIDPWSAAEKILNMRSDNPMVTILMNQLAAMQKSAEDAREREFKAQESAREREFRLQEELRKVATATATPTTKGFFEQLVEFAAPTDKTAFIQKIFGGSNGSSNGDAPARAGRVSGLEVARDLAIKIFDSPVGEGIGQLIASMAQRNAQQGMPVQGMNGNPAVNQAQQPPQASFDEFVRNTLNPALLRMYVQGFDGGAFAEWLYDGYPDRVRELQNYTHPSMPGLRGAQIIIAACKRTPGLWPALSSRGEPAFVQFVNEFCAWKPEPEGSEPDGPDEDGVIDLDDHDGEEARPS